MNIFDLSQFRKAEFLKKESRKMLVVSASIGIGSVISFLIGSLTKYLTNQSDMLTYGTILSSFVLMPFSILLGLSIWDKIRIKWSVSDELIFQLNFLESEFQRKANLIKNSGMSEEDIKKDLKNLVNDFLMSEREIREVFPYSNLKRKKIRSGTKTLNN